MVDPVRALILFGLLVLVVALIFWPRHGLVALIVSHLRNTERVRMEDSLKHLYNAESAGRAGTLESLAGVLQVSRARVVGLVARLEASGLMRTTDAGLVLSEDGRAYALRVVRSHRLWERFLADRSGLTPAEWHDQAEQREHTLSADQAQELSERMGHPRYDPHGDPIPTQALEVPPMAGTVLTALTPGQAGTIVHLEDEPRETYQHLIDIGLSPNMEILVLEVGPERIRFRGEGREHELEPIQAANVTVVPVAFPDAATLAEGHETLAELRADQDAAVIGISSACQGRQRRRLLDLGVVPGTIIREEFRSASGDPVAYRIRGALIALRRQQAEWIFVEPVHDDVEEVA
jgi:DtxR family Mn-dependent transcriptional regulator